MRRDFTQIINTILDDYVPPIVRDSRAFYLPLMYLVFGSRAKLIADFKSVANDLTEDEFRDTYRQAAHAQGRDTDLNSRCIDKLIYKITGGSVLEIGCGGGLLAGLLSKTCKVHAVDIVIEEKTRERHPTVKFETANSEKLPFADDAFDTVVTTHTLEHVRNLPATVAELRRVSRLRIIVIVPRQRPYRYTPDLHLHFFPTTDALVNSMRPQPGRYHVEVIGGDIYYEEAL